MAKEKRGLLDEIKENLQKGGDGNFKDIFFLKDAGSKARIRFLQGIDDGISIKFHQSKFGEADSYQHPCFEYYDRECPHCDGKEEVRYAWSVYDFESKSKKIFIYKANRATPIPHLIALSELLEDWEDEEGETESYGIDECIVAITRNDIGTNSNYTLTPLKVGENSKKMEPFTEDEVFEILKKAYKVDEEDNEELEVRPKKKKKKNGTKEKAKKTDNKKKKDEDLDDFDIDDY